MDEINIDRLDIKKYKKKVAKAAKRKFDKEQTQIIGLVSPVDHQMTYYGKYNIHRFILSIWQKNNHGEPSQEEITVYRIIHGETKDHDLNVVPLLSFVNINVYLDKKNKRAIFCDGYVLNESPSRFFQNAQNALKPAHSIFGAIKCVYKNHYESTSIWNGKTITCNFSKSKKESIMTFFLKILKIVHPFNTYKQNLEQQALKELFELKQKGWFKEESNQNIYTENDFLTTMSAGSFNGVIFEKRRFSIWYKAVNLFDGSRIVFNGNYDNGITEVRLNGDASSDKEILLNKNRDYIDTDHFGKMAIDYAGDQCSKNIPWLESNATLSFYLEQGKIKPKEMKIAEAIFTDQHIWNDKAYDYVIKHFLDLKNDSWLDTDEEAVTADEFKKLLGEFTLSFSEYDPYEFSFSFDTDDKFFAGHGIIIGGSLKEGFTGNELFG